MKNILKNKMGYVICLTFLILVIFLYLLHIESVDKNHRIYDKSTNKEIKKDSNANNEINTQSAYRYIKEYYLENKDRISQSFNDRISIIKNSEILIGTNQKELENGYYDICFRLKENKLEINIVKLWKDVRNSGIYDEYYVKELAICILKMCKKGYTELDIFKMKDYIINSYLDSKKGNQYLEELYISDIKIISEVKDGVLLISIY